MNNVILFDDLNRFNLLPLSFTRPICEFRIGILTISEKWKKYLNQDISYQTIEYLSEKYVKKKSSINLFINSALLPNIDIVRLISELELNEALVDNETLIAINSDKESINKELIFNDSSITKKQVKCEYRIIKNLWDVFSMNGVELEADFKLLTKNRKSAPISKTNTIFNEDNIFLEEGAKVECAILNASKGYIYIAKDAEIMEGAIVRGSLALCQHSVLKIGAKIYGPTTIGPHSKFGGEVNNTVVFGYSNKAHDGFLGNSVLGEWCNIGADSNNSNLKNNYAPVKLWNYKKQGFVRTGLQFCGLIMGDHSKCGINTMFNTGTVIGVSANIFGSGFPRNFIPSFSWGGNHGLTVYSKQKAFETAKIMMKRRNIEFNQIEERILSEIFNKTEKFRNF